MHIPRCRDRFPMADGALPTALGPGADAMIHVPFPKTLAASLWFVLRNGWGARLYDSNDLPRARGIAARVA
jgi:hypothetical protein